MEEIKKPKNRYLSISFFLLLIIGIYFAAQYLLSQFNYQKAKENAQSEFTNIETEIYQTSSSKSELEKTTEKPFNQNEILLKQQMQISELQSNLNALRIDLARVKTNESLAKIILSFIKLQDLFEAKQNYNSELQKLELLCRSDFALTDKISKLKSTLQNQPKNQKELGREFADLIPQLKAKQIEIESNGSWWGKIKATLARFVIIKRTNQNNASDIADTINKVQNAIENQKFNNALKALDSIDRNYEIIVTNFKDDLRKADNFEQISDEIYKYLELLSN